MNRGDQIWNFVLSKYGKWILFICWALLASNLWLPRNWSFYGPEDWDLTYSMFEASRISVMDYGTWPVYNPFIDFGFDSVADPQSGQFSIFFIPVLLFGTFYGYKFSILLSMLIAVSGAYKLFGLLNPDKKTALFSAIIFASLNYFSAHVFRAGHSNVLYVSLIPWLFYALEKLRNSYHIKYLLLAVFCPAQMIAGGAPIVFLLTFMLVAIQWIADIWIIKNRKFSAIPLAIIGAALLMNLWKIIPGIQLWQNTPRLVKDESGISLLEWFQSLGGFETRTGNWHAWWEYSLGFPLIMLGIVFYYRSEIQHWAKWLFLMALVIWLCMGNYPEQWNPWYWLNRYVPVFSSLRAPSRFGFVILFMLFTGLNYAIRNAKETALLGYLFFAAAIAQTLSFRADAGFVQNSEMMEFTSVQPDRETRSWDCVRNSGREKNRDFIHLLNREMVLNAYQPLNLPKVFDTTTNLFSGVKSVHFKPNKIELETHDSLVIINQRYSKFWQLEGKGKLQYYSGIMSIKNPGQHITLTYKNPAVTGGLMWSLTAFIPLLIVHFRRKKQ